MATAKTRLYKGSVYVIVTYLIVAALAPFIANDTPLACYCDGDVSFPVLSDDKTHSQHSTLNEKSACLWPLITYRPGNIDKKNQTGTGPFSAQDIESLRHRHWLGTDNLGRDVASGMIHGTATALKIGILSLLFAFILGVPAGLLSGYYRNDKLRINLPGMIASLFIFMVGCFFLFFECLVHRSQPLLFVAGFLVTGSVSVYVAALFLRIKKWKTYHFHFDTILMKLIELRKSLPGLFILLSLACIFTEPSVWNVVLIIALLGWTEIARYTRAETMAVSEENYIKSAEVLGLTAPWILFRHILPNILPTLAVIASFSLAGAILLESTLSFLGIGLPVEEVTWGKMLAEGRSMRSWWLVFFPGLAIFILILCLSYIADHIGRAKQGKLIS